MNVAVALAVCGDNVVVVVKNEMSNTLSFLGHSSSDEFRHCDADSRLLDRVPAYVAKEGGYVRTRPSFAKIFFANVSSTINSAVDSTSDEAHRSAAGSESTLDGVSRMRYLFGSDRVDRGPRDSRRRRRKFLCRNL